MSSIDQPLPGRDQSEEKPNFNTIYTRLLTDSITSEIKWVKRGIVGLSVFCICLGILGMISVIKVLFF